MPDSVDVVVVGGGIIGLATARSLLRSRPGISLLLLEKEGRLAAHQTGHNSGVIHSGLYYRPGSKKAALCVAGREELYRYCAEQRIPHRRCGKVVVATSTDQVPALEELERRGRANGLQGLKWLDAAGLHEAEPQVRGVAGLLVPETGVVDYPEVCAALAREIEAAGGEVRTGCRAEALTPSPGGTEVTTRQGKVACRLLVNCAGLHSDRVAHLAGRDPGVRIIPFRGEYYHLRPEGAERVRGLIYPVPDPSLPFLGVHLTRSIQDEVEAGPNAVLALKREGYRRWDVSPVDCWEILRFPGFWRMARRFWRVGLAEYRRSFSRRIFLRDLQQLLPNLGEGDLGAWGSGVRAQAVDRTGKLLDDFCILADRGMVHV